MRGKVGRRLDELAPAGITPAYAGKSGCRLLHMPKDRDHPRVCGEKVGNFFSSAKQVGSPPRMRGKDFSE